MDRSRASVRTASAGPRPERRVWIDSHPQPVSVRGRPRHNDSASLFGSQPQCFLDGLTAAEALIRGRQVFQLHQPIWCKGVRIRHVGWPTRELAFWVSPTPFVCCPFLKFFSWPGRWPGLRRAWCGGLAGVCFRRWRSESLHGVYDLDGPFGSIARYVYAHLRPYVGFLIRKTAPAPNHGERSLHNESFHSRKSK